MNRKSLIRLTMVLLFSGGAVANAQNSNDAATAEKPGSIHLAVAAQPIAAALNDFARQSGLHVVIGSEVAEGVRSAAIEGTFTPEAALQRLLANTGLRYEYLDAQTVAVLGKEKPRAEVVGKGSALRLAQADTASADSSSSASGQGTEEKQNASGSPENSEGTGLEEIIVTAERREEKAQDVPISMSAFSRDFINNYIGDAFAVANFTPNYQISGSNGFGQSSTASIRGLGSTEEGYSNTSTSVLTYYDGIALGTEFGATIPPWDLDRIEVQRGPQGTLYGRNAVAGAVQYISAAPTDEFEGYGQFTAGEFDLRRFEGAVSGPITENVKARISALTYDRAGDVTNTVTNTKQGNRDWWGGRGIIDWQVSDTFSARMKAQHFKVNDMEPLFLNAAPGNLFAPNTLAWFEAVGHNPDLSRESNFKRFQSGSPSDPSESFEETLVELDLNYDFGPMALTAVGGYVHGKDFTNSNSLAYAAPQADDLVSRSGLEQWSGELRLTSQTDHPLQWIAGAYYLHSKNSQFIATDLTAFIRDLDGDGRTRYNADSPEDLLDGLLPVFPTSTVMFSNGNTQKIDTHAFFLHTTYDWTDRLQTTHAVRHTYEEKDADLWLISFFDFPLSLGVTPGTIAQHNDAVAFARISPSQQRQQAVSTIADPNPVDANGNAVPVTRSDSWQHDSWRLGVNYRLTQESLLYASVSEGFKGGGFSLAAADPGAVVSVKPETSIVYEIGAKTEWWNNRLRLNAAGFYTEHRNFQGQQTVFTQEGAQILTLTNLPKVELYGGELEVIAVPFKNLMVAANFGIVETEITKVLPGNEALLGHELPKAEDMNLSGFVRYDTPTALGIFSPQVSWRYWGKYWSTKDNNDYAGEVGGFWTSDVRVGYEAPNGKLYGLFYVRNLFDEVHPLGNIPQPQVIGTTASVFNERRNWGVTVGYRF